MFDATHDTLTLSDFAVFEIKALMEADARYAIPTLLYLFRRIENSGTGPKAFVLDEGWVPLGHPLFRERAKTWFKTAAKANCAVILGTQSVSDVANSGIFDTLNEQCLNKIFLPNALALSSPESAAIYKSMGLSEHQIQRYIVESKRHRHYYQSTPEGSRMFELELGPFARAFVAQTNIAAATRVMALEKECGNAWVDVWLREKGLRYLAEAA
jgi:type IV secretion system protein VirB4